MVSIYMIEDINDMKYVGSTVKKLNKRLSDHRYDKRSGKYYSSSKLNLDNCIIILLEECNLEDRKEREGYWINEIDCVNHYTFNFHKKHYKKQWYINNVVKECMDDMIDELLL